MTVAAQCEVDELFRNFLTGHATAGINRKYIGTLVLTNATAMRKAQAKISEKTIELLGASPF